SPALQTRADEFEAAAARLRTRIAEVIDRVTVHDTTPPFVPFALELPSLQGKNEGPHERLTATRFGNYWNLFAPSFLELRFSTPADASLPNRWIFNYAETHGGLWAGLPRFYTGLDAAYAIGYIGELLDRSAEDRRARPQALAALHTYFLHAASRNSHSIPEVAGLFPHRLDRAAYEQLVREAPWHFGMYDPERYLQGHASFTEPLGSGAGAALTMIRNALMAETRNELGLPDGGLILLPTVPADWFAEGKEIVLENFPTAYGVLSVRVRSLVASENKIAMEYRFEPFDEDFAPGRFRVRFAPAGKEMREVSFDPLQAGSLEVNW
ncbi:MAG TPA: hypothetical protein VEA63_16090, partial [Opitutus sp.]|nr:hypothetical protein [Opitutus sp.]